MSIILQAKVKGPRAQGRGRSRLKNRLSPEPSALSPATPEGAA
jgi:hypothetical protein